MSASGGGGAGDWLREPVAEKRPRQRRRHRRAEWFEAPPARSSVAVIDGSRGAGELAAMGTWSRANGGPDEP